MEKLFTAKDISKTFGATNALTNVSLEVGYGEVVGLMGENGAGKSTLLKIIIGVQRPSSGVMTMNSNIYAPATPKDGNASGIGMVYQEQSLVPNLTVAQNIFFGFEKAFTKFGLVRWSKMNKEAEKILGSIGCSFINCKKKVSEYNFSTRQMIEIAKIINLVNISHQKNCLILLDEPTSVLNDDEVKQLFREIKKLTNIGHSVIFVSHRLDEVLEISDRIYVYKDGTNAGDMPAKNATESDIYTMMVGRETSGEYYSIDKQEKPSDEVVLEVRDIGIKGICKDINFKLHKREVLAICGVVGSGKEEIVSVICCDTLPDRGQIFLNGKELKLKSPSGAYKEGILMIPKNRLEEGIIGDMSVGDNILLSSFKNNGVNRFISAKKIKALSKEWINKLRIKTAGHNALLFELSGGNQQKVVFARALSSACDVLILNHPTRGVDIGAKEEIYLLIRNMVKEGKAVILLGDTLDECINMSNRVIVMKDGFITGEYDANTTKPSQTDIVKVMM